MPALHYPQAGLVYVLCNANTVIRTRDHRGRGHFNGTGTAHHVELQVADSVVSGAAGCQKGLSPIAREIPLGLSGNLDLSLANRAVGLSDH
jgi:hypothetical protein